MSTFRFKHFNIEQPDAALKVGTDAMVLGALCSFPNNARLLDVGTGTGVLALMCCQRFSPQEIIAIDMVESAVTCAQNNFNQATFKHVPKAIHSSLQAFKSETFDGIICNPPYFINSSKNANEQKRLARHTDELSFQDLAIHSKRLLSEQGEIWLICPYDSQEEMSAAFLALDFYLSTNITIQGKPDSPTRSILNFSKIPKQLNEKSLTIRNSDGTYSQAYITLTVDFHDRALG